MVTLTISPSAFSSSGSNARYLTSELTHNGNNSGVRDFSLYNTATFYGYTDPPPWPQGPSDGGRADCLWNLARKYDTNISPEYDPDSWHSFPHWLEEPYTGCRTPLNYSYPETSLPGWGPTAGITGSWLQLLSSWNNVNISFRRLDFSSVYPTVLVSLTGIVRSYYNSIFQPVPENYAVTKMWIAHDEYVTQPEYTDSEYFEYGINDNSPNLNWRYTHNTNGWGVRPRATGLSGSPSGYHIGFNYFGPEQFVSDSESALIHSGAGSSDWVEIPQSAIDAAYALESLDPENNYPVGMTFMGFQDAQLNDTPPIYPYLDFNDGLGWYKSYNNCHSARWGADLVIRVELGVPTTPRLGRLRVLVNPDGSTLNRRWKFANNREED